MKALVPGRLFWLAVLTVAAAALPPARSIQAANYTKYHTYDELTAALRDLAKSHTARAKLVEVAKTREGRTVWALEIANPAGRPVAERPALLIAANMEGDQLIGSELALFVAESLLGGYATSAEIRTRLDEHVFYVLPRINPDGAELMFGPLKSGRRTNTSPYDADNDGRMDEDGPEDLNGDGVITMMRVKDPLGPYMVHPDDKRLMRRADPRKGEPGGYAIYWEGTDNDGDGFINEDGPGGVDLNRNFQHKYPYYQPDAGPHMVSELETRGVMDYVLQRRNIAAVLTFGESDNLVAAPSRRGELGPASPIDLIAFADQSVAGARDVGVFRSQVPQFGAFAFQPDDDDAPAGRGGGRGGRAPTPPATTVDANDVEYFRTISDKYRQLTGLRASPATRAPGGALFEYFYYQFGVPSFSTPGWALTAPPSPSGGPPEQGAARAPAASVPAAPDGGEASATGTAAFDLRLLRWMDAEKIDGFVQWKAYRHPALGDVEIGGFRPYTTSNPPAEKIAELGKSHSEFVVYLSSLFPKIAIAKTAVTNHGGGLFRIRAEIENSGFLPTSSAQGVRSRSVKPTMVQLGVDPADIVSGAAKTSFFQALAGSGRRQTYEWIIRGKPGASVSLKVVSQKGGTETATLTLK